MIGVSEQRRTRLVPQERREQLLKCAIRVLAEQGIARATQSQVAAYAGVSVSAVYSYFRTREDLVAAALDEVGSFVHTVFNETLKNEKSSYDELVKLANIFFQSARDIPDHTKVWLDWSTSVESPFWPSYLECWEGLIKIVEGSLRRAKREGLASSELNVKAGATLFLSGAAPIIQIHFSNGSKGELDRFTEQLVCGAIGIIPAT